MKKNIFFAIIISAVIVSLFAAVKYSGKQQSPPDKITIVTTLFPLYDFAKTIGGDNVEVILLLPPGVEPHSFEPTPGDITKISRANIFVFTGEFMEPWAHEILSGISNKKLIVVDASKGINLIPASQQHEHHHEHGEQCKHHEHEQYEGMDPHIWLDFDNDTIIIDNITNALCEVDADNADFYHANAERYKTKLAQLDADYKTQLSDCTSETIVFGGHYAFGYMAKRYNLNYLAAQGLAPDSEPTATDLIALIEQIKKGNIRCVFYEELASPKIAETLASETGAKMLMLNPGHNVSRKDMENNISFIGIMLNNLQNLRTGLECK
jgi:zinc transport system substrate-binding protein